LNIRHGDAPLFGESQFAISVPSRLARTRESV